jgi:hypothetical protein
MAEDTPDKPEEATDKPSMIRPMQGVRMVAKSGLTAQLRVRLIQSSPYADPKLV